MKPEETIDFHIRWAWHSIARMYNLEASKHGSTMSVGQTLLNIDLEEGTPSTKLGPKMGMEPRSLTRTLKTMEEKGLIFRQPDEIDKRIRLEFPHKFDTSKDKPVSKPTQTVASATRSTKTNRKSVRLTSSQVAIAKKLGVPLEEYAKQLMNTKEV